jgi:peptidoglycan DL-endopeptidase LytF
LAFLDFASSQASSNGSAILAVNPGLDPNRLTIGQRICIPVSVPAACPGFTYSIQPGDTIYTLAARYGLAPEVLLAANPGLDPYRLMVGQTICIPVPRAAAMD